MRTLLLLFLACLLYTPAPAQQLPKADLFAGYSYQNMSFQGGERVNLHGWNASLTVPLNDWFGLTSDFSGHYLGNLAYQFSLPVFCQQPTPCLATLQSTIRFANHNFLFGPQFILRKKRISPYVHFLVGASLMNTATDTTVSYIPPLSDPIVYVSQVSMASNSVAFALGGGVHYNLTKRISWRVQSDYLLTTFGSGRQSNVRVSTGLVFHLGK